MTSPAPFPSPVDRIVIELAALDQHVGEEQERGRSLAPGPGLLPDLERPAQEPFGLAELTVLEREGAEALQDPRHGGAERLDALQEGNGAQVVGS